MTDDYYREQAAQRNLIIGIVVAVLALIAITGYFIRNAFYDTCTESFNREPEAVITSYINSVSENNTQIIKRCWDRVAYYDLKSGCSEICISRVGGTTYQIIEIALDDQIISNESRANIHALASINCPHSGKQHTAKIHLDSVSANVPWKHWKIIYSDFGGLISEPWCNK